MRALSLALHVPYSRLREVVDGNRGVSADTALRLERYFGSEAQGWLNLQTAYDLRVAEKLNSKTKDDSQRNCTAGDGCMTDTGQKMTLRCWAWRRSVLVSVMAQQWKASAKSSPNIRISGVV